MDEKEIIQQSDLVIADITSGNGILDPDRADRFIRRVVDQPTMIGEVRVVTMNAPQLILPKIGIGTRAFRAAVENTALTSNQRIKPSFGSVTLTTKEMMAEIRISYQQLEDNIEKGQLKNTILDLMAEQAALDWEDLLVNGDSAFVDGGDADNQAYMRLHDGILKRITSHTVDASTTHITPATFSAALKAMPNKYQRNKSQMRFYVTPSIEQDMRLAISTRQTALGDGNLTGAAPLVIQGVPVKPVAIMPSAKGFFLDPQNVILGIQRNIQIESERLIGERQIRFVVTCRIAIGIEEEDATVEITNFS